MRDGIAPHEIRVVLEIHSRRRPPETIVDVSTIRSEASPTERVHESDDESPFLLKLWVALLLLIVLLGTVSSFFTGLTARGIVSLLVGWFLLLPSAIGVALHRRFGFNLAILLLAFVLFGSFSMVFGQFDGSDSERGSRALSGMIIGAVAFA